MDVMTLFVLADDPVSNWFTQSDAPDGMTVVIPDRPPIGRYRPGEILSLDAIAHTRTFEQFACIRVPHSFSQWADIVRCLVHDPVKFRKDVHELLELFSPSVFMSDLLKVFVYVEPALRTVLQREHEKARLVEDLCRYETFDPADDIKSHAKGKIEDCGLGESVWAPP